MTEKPEGQNVGSNSLLGRLTPMEQLIAFVDWEAANNPRRMHVAKWALVS